MGLTLGGHLIGQQTRLGRELAVVTARTAQGSHGSRGGGEHRPVHRPGKSQRYCASTIAPEHMPPMKFARMGQQPRAPSEKGREAVIDSDLGPSVESTMGLLQKPRKKTVSAAAAPRGAKRSQEEVSADLQESKAPKSQNYKKDLKRYWEFVESDKVWIAGMVKRNKKTAAEKGWLESEGDTATVPPFNLALLARFSGWMLSSKWHRNSLIGFQYALNDFFERQGKGRPWLKATEQGGRLYDIEMQAYQDLRRTYDLLDGRDVKDGGAARIEEESVHNLLRVATQLAARITSAGVRVIGGQREDKRAQKLRFKRVMRCITMYVFMLRASSSRIYVGKMRVSAAGALTIKVDFWKKTKRRGYTSEPIAKTLPPVDSNAPGHPRKEYLRLMEIIISLGGFADLDHDVLEQARVVTGTMAEVFGGERCLEQSVKEGRKPTSHSWRKTGASAAFNSGVAKARLQKWGEWSRGNGRDPSYWGALKNYVDTDYQTTAFAAKFFDWMIVIG